MSITLNHTIVPAVDNEAAARFFASSWDWTIEAQTGISRRCGSTTP
ncbi:hypothetical protein AB0G54_24270 [Streptomyces yokosukanensis]